MLDAVWLRSQKTRKEEVPGDGIIAQQNGVQHFCGTIERSVAFHYDDAVRDDKVRTDVVLDRKVLRRLAQVLPLQDTEAVHHFLFVLLELAIKPFEITNDSRVIVL
jgi:hypothetical protein